MRGESGDWNCSRTIVIYIHRRACVSLKTLVQIDETTPLFKLPFSSVYTLYHRVGGPCSKPDKFVIIFALLETGRLMVLCKPNVPIRYRFDRKPGIFTVNELFKIATMKMPNP